MREPITVLVTGAYGQVGTAAIDELLKQGYAVLATGRNKQRLEALEQQFTNSQLSVRIVDVDDSRQLAKACDNATVLFNCVGPYIKNGQQVARVAVERGLHYIDVAGEQEHYRRLEKLAPLAAARSLALAPGFGLYPGLSGPLARSVAKRHPTADSLTIGLFAGNHLSADAGLASLLAAVLEMNYAHDIIQDRIPVRRFPGQPVVEFELPEPYGSRRLISWPQLDILAMQPEIMTASLDGIESIQTFAQLGEASPPSRFLVRLIRLLRPHKSQRTYAFLKRILKRINAKNYERARFAGLDSGGVIFSIAHRSNVELGRGIATFADGARGTVWLAVRTIKEIVSRQEQGLLIPHRVFNSEQLLAEAVAELDNVQLTFQSNSGPV